MKNDRALPKTDYNVSFKASQNLKNGLNNIIDELSANLYTLKNKHPEIFEKYGGVARTIKAINENPNRYYKNNRPDIALIASDLENGKLGKMGVVIQGNDKGKIGHLTVSGNKQKELERLKRRNIENLAVGAANPTYRSNALMHGEQMPTAKFAGSPNPNASIIPQNAKDLSKNPLLSFIKPENRPNISQNPFLNITNKSLQKEQRGIYNVAYNDKKSTIIHKDFDAIDNAIKLERGKADYISKNGTKKSGFGILHMQKHFDPTKNGYVKPQEVMKMGEIVRNVEPIIKDNKRVYEYFDNERTRFRVIVGDKKNGERIISFFSDRKGGLANDKPTYIYSPLNDNIISQKPVNNNMKKAFVTFFTDPLLPLCVVMYVSKHTSLIISFLKFFTKKQWRILF